MVPVQELVCPACNIKLQLFAINFEESIYLCPTEGCLYPLDQSNRIVLVTSNNICNDNEMMTPSPKEKTLDVTPEDTEQDNGSSVTVDGSSVNKEQPAAPTDSNNALLNLPKSMESIIRKVALANKNFSSLLPKKFLEPSSSSSSLLPSSLPSSSTTTLPSSSAASLLPSSSSPKKPVKRKIADTKCNSSTTTASLPPHLQQRKLNVNALQNKQVHYLQWPNSHALCWLDVILCLFVHNKMLKARVKQLPPQDRSILKTLFKAYAQAMKLFNGSNNQPEKSQSTAGLKAGNTSVTSSALPMAILKKAMVDNSVAVKGPKKKAVKLLLNVREAVWKQLQTKLQCKKGTNDGPVFALISLEKQEEALRDVFTIDYLLEFLCKQCQHYVTSSHSKMLPTLEAAPDFTMNNMQHIVKCSNCNCMNQCRILKPIKFRNAILLHFLKGIPFEDISRLNFIHNSVHYHVVGVVQYTNDPDHFIAWIKYSDQKWIKCDDLDGPVCSVNLGAPHIPKQEVHLVMWEKLKSDIPETDLVSKAKSVPSSTNQRMLPVVAPVGMPSAPALPVVTISDDSSSPIPSTSSSVTLLTFVSSVSNSSTSSAVAPILSGTTPSTVVSVLGSIMSSIETPVFGGDMSSAVVPVLSGTIPSAVVPVLSGTIPSAVVPVLSGTLPSSVVSVIDGIVTSAVTPALKSTVSQLVSPALCSTMSQPVISALCSTVSPLATQGLCSTVSPLATTGLYSTMSSPALCSTVSSLVAPAVNTTESSAALSTISPTVAPVQNIMLSPIGTPISCGTLLSVENSTINGPKSVPVTPTSTTQLTSTSSGDSYIIPMSVSPSGLISISNTPPSEVVLSLPVMTSSPPDTLLTQLVSSVKEESSSLTSASPVLKSALLNSSSLLASERVVSVAEDSILQNKSASQPTQPLSSCITGTLTPVTISNQIIYPVQTEPSLSMNTTCIVQNTPDVVRPGQSEDSNQQVNLSNYSQDSSLLMEVKQQSLQPLPASKGNTKTLPIKLECDANHLNKLKANLAMVKRFKKW